MFLPPPQPFHNGGHFVGISLSYSWAGIRLRETFAKVLAKIVAREGYSFFWRPTHLRSLMLLRKEPPPPPAENSLIFDSRVLTKKLNSTAHEILIFQIKYKPLKIFSNFV